MPESDNDSGGPSNTGGEGELSSPREQDRFLPIANVSRIMKKALPANAKISKDAKETVQECVSEFISFITGEASDKCQREKRKTINGDDLLWAMTTLGFEDYVDPLKHYLHKFREIEGERAAATSTSTSTTPDMPRNNNNNATGYADAPGGMMMMGQPIKKKLVSSVVYPFCTKTSSSCFIGRLDYYFAATIHVYLIDYLFNYL
ncbi:Nuclear transcription factor Y subunit B-3 [Triticum urartu]|uniref:Nuclear transcription factor Y subunit B-3 n=1 Tax=Triticum urartu TaxID=4572 RepID=M8AGE6_TRIUA|nr:Nuclear transcription factor Y subunit B-3 [Triticum urartu]